MFENIPLAPPDAIFGLNEAMKSDNRPEKISLGAGVYKDETGKTPILQVVKEAEKRLLEQESSKSYLPIDGLPAYDDAVRALVLGDDHPAIADDRALTAQTPGGTGALRVLAETAASFEQPPRVWMSEPTWANHGPVFAAGGLEKKGYPYYDAATHGLDFEAMTSALEQGVQAGDFVLLHGCCHNPTGVDPKPEQWRRLGELLQGKSAVPIIDFAYQGFVAGVDEDAVPIRELATKLDEMIVCSSFSKNLGLYAERVGAVTLIAEDAGQAKAVMSQLKRTIRTIYSNPPTHGGSVAATVLGDDELRLRWREELRAMRERIHAMRHLLASSLSGKGVQLSAEGNDFITEQNGMFSFSGLDREQVLRLRDEHAVYMVDSGRLNVAGITRSNIERLTDAIAAVVA